MFFIYSLLLTLGFLALLPRFLYDALRKGKYSSGFRERMGILTPIKATAPVIWLHCVSVGETQAARSLVQQLKNRFPDHQLVISTITLTGQTLARNIFKDSAARIFYFPFDWGFTVRRSLSRIKPTAVLLMETEIWPGFIRECNERDIRIAIINGRISDRSFRRYKLARRFIAQILSMIDIAVMQSSEDAERIEELGMACSKVSTSGNLKFDVGTIFLREDVSAELRALLGSSSRPILVAASTHAPEERILLKAFQELRQSSPTRPMMVIAPRHPERFAEVESMMAKSGLEYVKRTERAAGAAASDLDLILLDTIGELPAVYEFASIVFVGGSIAKAGGHNILEPAIVGSCIVTGAHTFNFKAVVREFLEQGALMQLPPLSETDAPTELAHLFSTLLNDEPRREQLKKMARAVVEANLGATERTIKLIAPLLTSPNPSPTETVLAATQVRL
jgi:3-deoxy-D-manno-octulosonic-acid transferase